MNKNDGKIKGSAKASEIGASGVETDIPGTEHFAAGARTNPEIHVPAEEQVDLSGVPNQTNETTTTERISVTETVNESGKDTVEELKEERAADTQSPTYAPTNSAAKWLIGGVVALILACLTIGYFVTKAKPSQVAKAVPTVAPTTTTPPIGVEIKVPLPTGVDATGCRPDQMIVDRENHALRFPASCSKIIFDQPAK